MWPWRSHLTRRHRALRTPTMRLARDGSRDSGSAGFSADGTWKTFNWTPDHPLNQNSHRRVRCCATQRPADVPRPRIWRAPSLSRPSQILRSPLLTAILIAHVAAHSVAAWRPRAHRGHGVLRHSPSLLTGPAVKHPGSGVGAASEKQTRSRGLLWRGGGGGRDKGETGKDHDRG